MEFMIILIFDVLPSIPVIIYIEVNLTIPLLFGEAPAHDNTNDITTIFDSILEIVEALLQQVLDFRNH